MWLVIGGRNLPRPREDDPLEEEAEAAGAPEEPPTAPDPDVLQTSPYFTRTLTHKGSLGSFGHKTGNVIGVMISIHTFANTV